jgi:outer membrane protein OmpU
MKNLLIATTAIVATAGMASAEITFSGKGEAGMYRTGKTNAVALKYGVQTQVGAGTSGATNGTYSTATDGTVGLSSAGVVTVTAATGTAADATAATVAVATANVAAAKITLAQAEASLNLVTPTITGINEGGASTTTDVLSTTAVAATAATVDTATDAVAVAKKDLALAEAALAAQVTGATAAVAASDMVAYSGYDMNVALSGESDNGIVFGMGFDMGAGLIADQNDDRAMDTQGATIATSALTATMNGYKLSIGSDKLDDTYDDSQNGDIGLSGNIGSVAFNLVHDLTDEVVAKAAAYTATNIGGTRASATGAFNAAGGATSSTTIAAGDSDVVNASYSAAVAATIETTSLSLGSAVGDIAWSLAATTGDDRGDSAAKGSVTYSGIENLSLTLAHDNVGKLEGITKVTAKYTMGSLTATLSMADDKNKNSNSNVGGKASNNLSLAYAANGLAATFATDESSQWWVNTQYDLGGGAQAFATIDHTEFAVVGLNFAF